MFTTSNIQIRNLSYTFSGSEKYLFRDLNLQFNQEKLALVGRNGVGKSTLLKLIVAKLNATSGSVVCTGNINYLPQDYSVMANETVAKVIGVDLKLAALERIRQGSIDEHDYTVIGDDWFIEEKSQEYLARFNLAKLSLQQPVKDLSGGEQTRLVLLKVFMSEADFILLDEPSNNLDLNSREILYNEIENFVGGLIIVSHDRQLLRKMDKIIELNSLGASTYGGNYDDYIEQKEIEVAAAEHAVHSEIQTLNKAKKSIQDRMEKHQKNVASGKRQRKDQIKARGQVDKIAMNSAKGRSENTNRRIRIQAKKKEHQIQSKLSAAKAKVEITNQLNIDLAATSVPSSKVVLECDNVSFAYENSTEIIKNFNFKISGPERVAICGENGSGKSTLIKLIMGKLKAQQGVINLGVEDISYLDQHANSLDDKLSILENFKKFNPELDNFTCRSRLAQFLFRNKAAEKIVNDLSGGERLRALLACILMSDKPPQLLVLDEPSNHLDLDSIKVIEETLQQYKGAMIVISHDGDFLENIGVDRIVSAPFNNIV